MGNNPEKVDPIEENQTINYADFGSIRVLTIQASLFTNPELEVYSKQAPIEPSP